VHEQTVIECPADHPALPALFNKPTPNSPVLWAVLQGRHSGKALVDDIDNPHQCVVRTDAVLTFFGGDISQAFLDRAVTHFRQRGPVWLVWPPEATRQRPPPESAHIVRRVEFHNDDPNSAVLIEWRNRLPDGFVIRFIDGPILARCEWRDEMAFYCGSLENFLEHGIGLCLMRGDEIIVEAYASSLGKTMAEIGAITHEMHRGHGYAAIASAYLIEASGRRGYGAYWSCDAENLASIRVARKLGLQRERGYQIIEYDALS
jgi:RimJ/RimL family protein N-acetyltransferase